MYREKTVCYKYHVPFIFVFLFLRSNYDCNVLRQLNFHANSLLMLHEYSGVLIMTKHFFFSIQCYFFSLPFVSDKFN